MSFIERLFHAAVFEIIALSIIVPLSAVLTGNETTTMTVALVGVALLAMTWNYVFNIIFDHVFGHHRINRTVKLRLFHGVCFEAGLILVTIPFLMWQLHQDFWSVLIMDIGFVMFFLVYAILFNWCYDKIRFVLTTPRQSTRAARRN